MAKGRNLNLSLIDKALVGNRYTFEELKERLNNLSSEKVDIGISSDDELVDGEDFKIDFTSDTGYGTIWYLKTRTEQLYITEVMFEVDTFTLKEVTEQ